MDFVSLQQAAAGGSESARTELIQALYPRVQSLVHKQLQQDYRRGHAWILPLFSTGDVVQDVFRSIVQSGTAFESLDGTDDEDAFARLCATLVRNRLVDALRHHEAERRDARRNTPQTREEEDAAPATPGQDPTPSAAVSLQEQLGIFQETLESFPERERALLAGRLVEQREYQELADALGYPSPDAARKAFAATQAKLVVRLRQKGLTPPGDASFGGRS